MTRCFHGDRTNRCARAEDRCNPYIASDADLFHHLNRPPRFRLDIESASHRRGALRGRGAGGRVLDREVGQVCQRGCRANCRRTAARFLTPPFWHRFCSNRCVAGPGSAAQAPPESRPDTAHAPTPAPHSVGNDSPQGCRIFAAGLPGREKPGSWLVEGGVPGVAGISRLMRRTLVAGWCSMEVLH